jgi:hypothetical protein
LCFSGLFFVPNQMIVYYEISELISWCKALGGDLSPSCASAKAATITTHIIQGNGFGFTTSFR